MGYSEIHIKKKHLKALAEVKKIKGFEKLNFSGREVSKDDQDMLDKDIASIFI